MKLLPFVHRPRIMRGARLPEPIDAEPIRTERLLLRPHRKSDVEAWYEIQTSPAVLEQVWYWPKRTREQSRQHLKDRTRHTRLWQTDDFLALAIEKDGQLIGDISLHLRAVREVRMVEMSWLLHPEYTGHGYATEAARLLIDQVFERMRVHIIVCQTKVSNTASIALAERLGFQIITREAGLLTMVLGTTACDVDTTDEEKQLVDSE